MAKSNVDEFKNFFKDENDAISLILHIRNIIHILRCGL
jgi:hypothetical protein